MWVGPDQSSRQMSAGPAVFIHSQETSGDLTRQASLMECRPRLSVGGGRA